jgi:hypothetical protein
MYRTANGRPYRIDHLLGQDSHQSSEIDDGKTRLGLLPITDL